MKKKKYPYYRVTVYVKTPGVLETWFQHFSERNIPCAIAQGPQTKSYALWAVGTEAVEFDDEAGNMEPIGSLYKTYRW